MKSALQLYAMIARIRKPGLEAREHILPRFEPPGIDRTRSLSASFSARSIATGGKACNSWTGLAVAGCIADHDWSATSFGINFRPPNLLYSAPANAEPILPNVFQRRFGNRIIPVNPSSIAMGETVRRSIFGQSATDGNPGARRIVVMETKGGHLQNPDTDDKRAVLNFLMESSTWIRPFPPGGCRLPGPVKPSNAPSC